jgi:hypothetical protein
MIFFVIFFGVGGEWDMKPVLQNLAGSLMFPRGSYLNLGKVNLHLSFALSQLFQLCVCSSEPRPLVSVSTFQKSNQTVFDFLHFEGSFSCLTLLQRVSKNYGWSEGRSVWSENYSTYSKAAMLTPSQHGEPNLGAQ